MIAKGRDWIKTISKFGLAIIRPAHSHVVQVYQSRLLDTEVVFGQTRAQLGKIAGLWKTAKYLYLPAYREINPGPGFDASWYRQQYSDVGNSAIHPFLHYIKSGRLEGRLPSASKAVYLDALLWKGAVNVARQQLIRLADNPDTNTMERQRAYWFLARWALFTQNVTEAAIFSQKLLAQENEWEPADRLRFLLLSFDIALGNNEEAQAEALQANLEAEFAILPEVALAKINLLGVQGMLTSQNWSSLLNRIYEQAGLPPIALQNDTLSMHSLRSADLAQPHLSNLSKASNKSLVSVIVPMYNAAETVAYVLECLNNQSWPNLEIIISDDCSTDNSVELVRSWIARQPVDSGRKWKLLEGEHNSGAYAVRNRGMAAATGEYLTVNDADDWAHCQKIELQVNAILESGRVASVSSMVRTLPNLTFWCWRLEERWVFRNVSSLMISTQVIRKIGYWDEIKAGADTEYYYRLLRVFGDSAVEPVLPDVPLSFQLVRNNSLTQSADLHLATQFEGPRKWYLDAAFAWHADNNATLFLEANQKQREFYAPASLITRPQVQPECDAKFVFQAGALWNAAWYVQRYGDLRTGSVCPLEHFISKGVQENRDPGPRFSLSGWQLKNKTPITDIIGTLAKYEGQNYHPTVAGKQKTTVKENILLVGHQANQTIYGAERSLIDLAVMLSQQQYNVYILLPEVHNQNYIDQLLQYCIEIKVIPYGWWYETKQAEMITVDAIGQYIRQRDIALVHVNTLVLHEPMLAAQQVSIPCIVHIREDLPSDPSLLDTLLSDVQTAHQRLAAYDANLLFNSRYLVESFKNTLPTQGDNFAFIYNALDTRLFGDLALPSSATPLKVGLISSNLPKKGIRDFFDIAANCRADSGLTFHVYGPRTSELEWCLNQYALSNLIDEGYVSNPMQAIENVDIVLSLSHFNESFGRTIAEAQAAGRIAIAYDKGAPGELIKHEETGFLVPFQDVKTIAALLVKLNKSPDILTKIGLRAKQHAQVQFSYESCGRKLNTLYRQLISF